MKTPTTEYSIDVQEKIQINREFLLSEGWRLEKEYPLYESYIHSKNSDLVCGIGLYGSFSVCELHWCNKTPEKEFTTMNPNLTKNDYFKILSLLNIKY
jgi:hypothetical protein